MSSYYDEISARLAELTGTATAREVRAFLNEFDVRDIEAVRVSEGGSGATPIQAVYTGNPVSIEDNTGAQPLPWTNLASGTELLDRTDPLAPLVLAAGTYAITCAFSGDGNLAPGGAATGILTLTTTDFGTLDETHLTFYPGPGTCEGVITIVSKLAAGDGITASLGVSDGSAATFSWFINVGVVVKLA